MILPRRFRNDFFIRSVGNVFITVRDDGQLVAVRHSFVPTILLDPHQIELKTSLIRARILASLGFTPAIRKF